ncbi:proprotein convertase subtilisin/kexin type 5-like [Saccostrea cucullata]|uniref:proprotein convertase subtilisin/kexin type 5-like n=1 Tax=Saccostrea cuccullata TaxID=36930 RepID=UPI002ED06CAE
MDLEQFHCPKFICQKEYPYCFDGNCLDSCPEYTIGYTNSCVMTCPSEAKYITAVSCEGVCYSGYKFCSSECPVSHPFQFRLNHYYHCLKECPSFTMQNSTKCELSCPDDRPLLFNKTCRSTCPLSSPFTSLKTSVFNKIYVCSERCDDMMASYRNVCVSVCPSKSPMEYHGKCVETCLKDRPFINTTPAKKASIYYQQCVAKCPPDKFLWLKNKKCVTDCPAKSPLEYRGKCVEACQKDRPFINTEEMTSKYHQQCVSKCPPDKLAWIKNKRCVNNCLTNTLLFNKTCVEVCPQTFPLNYTKVEHGKREHICVKKCPGNAYQYKYFCFDQCPSYLKYFLSNCTLECPKTYPYIHIDNVTCVQSCPDHYVYNGKRCAEKCPREHFYIENKQCVNVCSNISALQRQTNQGIVCLNSFFCPIDTVLMENTTQCYGRCPESLLIINNICTHGISCPNNTYKENFSLGTMCTKKCSEKLYMDVNRCVKNCPSSKVIVGHRCSNDCPKSKPYRLIDTKHFGKAVRKWIVTYMTVDVMMFVQNSPLRI